MATDGPDLPPCEREIFKTGTTVIIVAGVPTNAMERWVVSVREQCGQRVDWHFAAGRAVVKAIGDIQAVRHAVHQRISDLPLGAMYSLWES